MGSSNEGALTLQIFIFIATNIYTNVNDVTRTSEARDGAYHARCPQINGSHGLELSAESVVWSPLPLIITASSVSDKSRHGSGLFYFLSAELRALE